MNRNSFICLIGVDGVGKSTHSHLLVNALKTVGIKSKYAHLRFMHLTSIPLLIYARIAGYSKLEPLSNGRKISYHFFENSKFLRCLYPITRFIDVSIGSFFKIYIPLVFGTTVVCDRFVYDSLVDLMISTGKYDLYNDYVGKLFLKLMPKKSTTILLTTPEGILRKRRLDVNEDITITTRIKLYNTICKYFNIASVDTSDSIKKVKKDILKIINLSNNLVVIKTENEKWDDYIYQGKTHYLYDDPIKAYKFQHGTVNGELYYNEVKLHALKMADIVNNFNIILDAGCARGYMTRIYKEHYKTTNVFIGIDFSSELLKNAKNNCDSVILSSLTHLPIMYDSIDIVMCSEVLEHIFNYKSVIKEFNRILSDGDKLIITTPNGIMEKFLKPLKIFKNIFKKRTNDADFYEKFLNPQDLILTLFQLGFKIKHFEIAFPYIRSPIGSVNLQKVFNLIIKQFHPWFFGSRQVVIVKKT